MNNKEKQTSQGKKVREQREEKRKQFNGFSLSPLNRRF